MAPRTLPVRLYHWSQAAGFVLASQVLEFGETGHRVAGYSLAGLVALRLVWGLAGAREDRLAGYLHGVQAWVAAGKVWRHGGLTRDGMLGHSMALLLMLLMLLTALTGYLQTTDRYWGEAWMMNAHATCSNLLTALVLLHVATQLWRSRCWHDSPLRRMLWMRRSEDGAD